MSIRAKILLSFALLLGVFAAQYFYIDSVNRKKFCVD